MEWGGGALREGGFGGQRGGEYERGKKKGGKGVGEGGACEYEEGKGTGRVGGSEGWGWQGHWHVACFPAGTAGFPPPGPRRAMGVLGLC